MPLLNRQLALIPRDAAPRSPGGQAAGADGALGAARRPDRGSARVHAGIFSTCSNPRCGSGWLRLWRHRETPVFEGGWCCSPGCTAARVAAALAREMDGRGSARESHRHRIPLGLAMLEQGWITPSDLRAALAAQRAAGGGRLGGWLVRQQSVNEDLVTRALGLQWGCPVLGMEFHNPEGLTALVPRLFVDAFGALPLRVAAGKILYMGFEDHLDPALALAVERVSGFRGRERAGARVGVPAGAGAHARGPVSGGGADRGRDRGGARRRALENGGKSPPRGIASGESARLPVVADVARAARRASAGAWLDPRRDWRGRRALTWDGRGRIRPAREVSWRHSPSS